MVTSKGWGTLAAATISGDRVVLLKLNVWHSYDLLLRLLVVRLEHLCHRLSPRRQYVTRLSGYTHARTERSNEHRPTSRSRPIEFLGLSPPEWQSTGGQGDPRMLRMPQSASKCGQPLSSSKIRLAATSQREIFVPRIRAFRSESEGERASVHWNDRGGSGGAKNRAGFAPPSSVGERAGSTKRTM